MNLKYPLLFLAGLALQAGTRPALAQSPGVQPGAGQPFPGFPGASAATGGGLQPGSAAPAPTPVQAPGQGASGQGASGQAGDSFALPRTSGTQSPASQIPLAGIQPVDNQAIINGLADAASPAGSQAGSSDSPQEKSRRLAFDSALNGLFPMRPGEIKSLVDRLHENESVIADQQFGNPKAIIKAETISTEPGSDPKTIEMEVGYVTTIEVLDGTGNPWPIQDIGIGGNFEVPAPEEGSNIIRMTPLAKYAVGNMSMRLIGLNTPLSFKLRASTGTVFYRYDARIPKLGPKAVAPLIQHGNDLVAGDSLLMNILDGSPPLSSTRLSVTGVDQRTAAWRIGTKVYLRTPLTLLSPGWEGSVGSGDGTHVYLIPDTPVLLLSDNGNMVHGRIGNNAKVDEQPVPAIEDNLTHPLRTSAAVQEEYDNGTLTRASDDTILPSPSSSRTLIRPIPARATGQAAPAAGNAANGTSPAGAAAGAPAAGARTTASTSTQSAQ